MAVVKGLPVEDLLRRGSIKELDVARFRRALQDSPVTTRADAEALMSVDLGCPVKEAAWSAIFRGAIVDYIVDQAAPEGYVTAENAGWLAVRIAGGGYVASRTELDLLLGVIEKARWMPESLCVLALSQVRRAVLTAEGPLRTASGMAAGHITGADVAILRRILLAFGGGTALPFTQREIEGLLDIDEGLQSETPPAEWSELLVRVLLNALLGEKGFAAASRREAIGAGAEHAHTDVARVLDAVWPLYRAQPREERAIAQLERRRLEIITGEDIRPLSADWLAGRIARRGASTVCVAGVLGFLEGKGMAFGGEAAAGRIGAAA